MKKTVCFLFVVLLITVFVGCSNQKDEDKTFSNPVFEQASLLDPSVILADDGYYYMYVSGGTDKWDGVNETICYAPIYKSKDMVSWSFVGSAFEKKDYLWNENVNLHLLWSPEIAFIDGKYVYYYSLGVLPSRGDSKLNGVGVAVSDYPDGPFEYVGKVFDGYDVDNLDCIDPFIVKDNGKVYMFSGNYDGIFYIELESDGLSAKKENGKIVPHYIAGGRKEGGIDYNSYSAPCVAKINGKWQLFLSTGAWNELSGDPITYHTVVFSADTLIGPYADSLGRSAMQNGSGDLVMDSGNGFYNPGCVHVYPDKKDNYYIFFHSYLEQQSGKRYLGIEKLNFDNGYPQVLDGMPHTKVQYPST